MTGPVERTDVEWATPDVSGSADRPAPEDLTRTPAPPGPSSPMGRLGPMTASDILDGGFEILRRAPATVIGLTAAFVVPVYALGGWLGRGADGVDLGEAIEQGDASLGLGGPALSGAAATVLTVGPMLALVFVAAALARLVSAWYVGHDLSIGALLRGSLTQSWPLLASWVLVHLLEAVALIGVVLPLAVMTWFLVTAPVIGAERLGPVAAMRRSARLVRRRFWAVLGVALLGLGVEQLFETAIGLVPSVLSTLLGTEGLGWLLAGAVGILTSLVTIPVVAGITVLIYLDLRVRTEALDLELDAIDAFPDLS